MADDVMNFLDGADLPTYDAWIAAAKSVVTENLFEELLYTDLGSGIRTEPMYIRQGEIEDLSYPTQGISRRASNLTGLLSGWNIRQRYWVNSLEESNAAILNDLEKGTNSIECKRYPMNVWSFRLSEKAPCPHSCAITQKPIAVVPETRA